MKFKNTITANAKLKRKKYHDFDFSEEQVKKGLKATYDKPFVICDYAGRVKCLYKDHNGKLAFTFLVSFYGFEIVEEEK